MSMSQSESIEEKVAEEFRRAMAEEKTRKAWQPVTMKDYTSNKTESTGNTQNKEGISWRDYDPGPEIRGSWCPLMNQRCMGAVCGWWHKEAKSCIFREIEVLMFSIQLRLDEIRWILKEKL